ncbi:hypothetical protein EYC80_000253 [Monilinia laxa]|uniref:Uncharacterized protein n=1 Tax=Monilinia laxa TaxID=61186 RepID=A0A5N6KA22_MONLA|nr:hypothetical protein EYC80_000253 [Monilinia laxa]
MTPGLDIEQHGLTLGLGRVSYSEVPPISLLIPKFVTIPWSKKGNPYLKAFPHHHPRKKQVSKKPLGIICIDSNHSALAVLCKKWQVTLSSYLILQAKSSRRSQYR